MDTADEGDAVEDFRVMAANVLRILRGAGNPSILADQCAALAASLTRYPHPLGTPLGDNRFRCHATAGIWSEWNCTLMESAWTAINRAALRDVAGSLDGNTSQRAAARGDMHNAISQLDDARRQIRRSVGG